MSKRRKKYQKRLRSTVSMLIVVAAISVLVATLWLPVFRIYGSSMSPALTDGNIVIAVKSKEYRQGDIIAFYYNNKILVKRVIGSSSDWVDISDDGSVYINSEPLSEPYVQEKSLGECDIKTPYQVPDERYFVMGDHRAVSVDSRQSSIGCVAEEQIAGKLVFCIWPLTSLGKI